MLIRGSCTCVRHIGPLAYIRTRTHKETPPRYITSLLLPSFPTSPPPSHALFFFYLSPPLSLSLSLSVLSVYARTQIPRVDVGTVISPESKAPASGVGTSVREFLNPFLHDSCSAWLGLRLCPGLACCRLRVVGRYRRGTAASLYRVFRDAISVTHAFFVQPVVHFLVEDT
jgi:hypothetical protein